MSATWCAGSPTNEYAGQGGHWYDPAGIAAPKPVANCVCPADVEVRGQADTTDHREGDESCAS